MVSVPLCCSPVHIGRQSLVDWYEQTSRVNTACKHKCRTDARYHLLSSMNCHEISLLLLYWLMEACHFSLSRLIKAVMLFVECIIEVNLRGLLPLRVWVLRQWLLGRNSFADDWKTVGQTFVSSSGGVYKNRPEDWPFKILHLSTKSLTNPVSSTKSLVRNRPSAGDNRKTWRLNSKSHVNKCNKP